MMVGYQLEKYAVQLSESSMICEMKEHSSLCTGSRACEETSALHPRTVANELLATMRQTKAAFLVVPSPVQEVLGVI